MYEIRAAIRYAYYAVKDSWEQARFIAYMTAHVNSKNKLALTDIIQFPWEKDTEDEDKTISSEDIERLRKESQEYLNKH